MRESQPNFPRADVRAEAAAALCSNCINDPCSCDKEDTTTSTYTVISVKTDGTYEPTTSITQAHCAAEAERNCITPGYIVIGVLEGQQVLI